MKTFASIDPRRLHTDPEPWRFFDGRRVSDPRTLNHFDPANQQPVRFTPRPEYIPATTHGHNRALEAARAGMLHDDNQLSDWLLALDERILERRCEAAGLPPQEFDEDDEILVSAYKATDVTDEEIEHANIVLTRLREFRDLTARAA